VEGSDEAAWRRTAAPSPGGDGRLKAPSPTNRNPITGVPMRIIHMGTPFFAVPALDALVAAGHEIVAVYTRAPKPAGRGKQLQQSPVHMRAEALGIPVFTPRTFRDPAGCGAIRQPSPANADVATVAAYGLILPPAVLAAPPPWLPEHPRFPAAALARGGADPARHPGRR
jgi:hypothetical protein